jgi:hypothetical protein
MNLHEKLEFYDPFDVAILQHGYAAHLRDYELLAETQWGEGRAGRYRYVFTHCVYSSCETRVRDDVWPLSWDDHFTDYQAWERAGQPEGYVWGTCWALAYPGLQYVKSSPRAAEWTGRVGREMHEITLETNAYFLIIVFHDLIVEKLN